VSLSKENPMSITEILIATGVGGVVLFLFSAICWMALPHHHRDTRALGDKADGVRRALKSASLSPAWYMLPHMNDFEQGWKDPAFEEVYQQGPNASIVIMPPGPCMEGSTFLKGFMMNLLQGLGFALLVHVAGENAASLGGTVAICAGAGLLLTAVPGAAQAIWWKFPWRSVVTCGVDSVVGAALVGVAIHFVV
jgi:hypothetical protein